MNAFWKFLSSEEGEIDSVITLGGLGFVALLIFTGYALWTNPATFSPMTFAPGVGTILAAVAGGKRVRDGVPNQGGQ